MKLTPKVFPPWTLPKSYICHQCRSSKPFRLTPRNYSTSSPPAPPLSGRVLLKSRRLIHISGPDSAHYLQGAITANISATAPRTSGFFAAFLNAQGRVLNDVFIYPILPHTSTFTQGKYGAGEPGQNWLIEVDKDEAEKLAKHIKKYKLRAKFDIRLLEDGEGDVWSVWREGTGKGGCEWTAHGFSGSAAKGSQDVGQIPPQGTELPKTMGCLDSRAPGMGERIIVPGSQNIADILGADIGIPEASEDSYTIRRYLNGIAEGQKEILRETALVQESNLDWMGAVDYRKGCYVGQELTIRTYHTGVVRKRILPLILYNDGEPIPESLEYKDGKGLANGLVEGAGIGRVGKKGRSAGKWLAGVGNLGLGLVRLEIMTGTVVQGEGGGFKEGDEFKIDGSAEEGGDGTVKAKAFVPCWHLTR